MLKTLQCRATSTEVLKLWIQELHSEDGREYQIQGEKVTCQPWLLGGLSGACWLNLWCATLSDSHLVREAKISPCSVPQLTRYLWWVKEGVLFPMWDSWTSISQTSWLMNVSKIDSVINNLIISWLIITSLCDPLSVEAVMCTVAPYRDASLSCLGSDERSQRVRVQGL